MGRGDGRHVRRRVRRRTRHEGRGTRRGGRHEGRGGRHDRRRLGRGDRRTLRRGGLHDGGLRRAHQRLSDGLVEFGALELPRLWIFDPTQLSEESELVDDETGSCGVNKSLATDHVGVRPCRARADPGLLEGRHDVRGGGAGASPGGNRRGFGG